MAITTKEVVAMQSSVGSRETLEDQIFSVNKLDNPLVNLLLIAPLDLWLIPEIPYSVWSRMSSHRLHGVTKRLWIHSSLRRASRIVLPLLAHPRDKLSEKNWKGSVVKNKSAPSVSRISLVHQDPRSERHVTMSLTYLFNHPALFQMINLSCVKFLDSLLPVPELWFTYSSMFP